MKNLKHINRLFYKYKWHLIGGFLFITISNIYAILPAIYIRNAFNEVVFCLKNNQTQLLSKILLQYSLFIIGSSLLKGLFMFFMRQTIIVMSRHIEFEQKNEIYAQYQSLNQDFYKKNNTGDLMSRISEDVSRVRMYTGPAIMYFINLVVLFAIVIYNMLQVNTWLTFLVLIPLPLLAYLIYKVSNKINVMSEQVQQSLSTITTLTQESFAGIRIIKSYAKEILQQSFFNVKANQYMQRAVLLAKTEAWFSPLVMLLIGSSSIITIYYGGLQVLKKEISIGNIAEFIIYINMLTWPVTSLGWLSSLVQRAEASQKRINEFLLLKPTIQLNETQNGIDKIEKIEFKQVSFTYLETGINALNNITFSLNAGESIGIIGKTGSGKSTILQLLNCLYLPLHGEIKINDKNIKELNIAKYRQLCATVPQDVFLFSDTITNNILFASNSTNKEDAIHFAKLAALHANILQFSNNYDTIVGERGVTLSGGQKQRVSIARALATNPQLILLDDCLSALDVETESNIIESISKLKNVMQVIVTHRISSVLHCNKIIVLDNGSIIEHGTHQELLLQNGFYKKIYEKQIA